MRSLFLYITVTLFYLTCGSNACFSAIRDPFSFSLKTKSIITPKRLTTAWIPIYFVDANKISAIINDKKNKLLSSAGISHATPLHNQLWIRDDKHHIKTISRFIGHIDKRAPQFLIKARIITVDRKYQRELGISFSDKLTQDSKNNFSPDSSSSTNTFSISLAKLAQNHLINLKLSALEQSGHATLIANPTLLTLNNKMASIESGAEVPYEEATSSGATSVSFKKAVLSLKVTPSLLPHHQVLLHISLNQDKVSALTVKGVPAIETQRMHTQVITPNKQMIILGGILEENHALQSQGIPILSHTPLIGHLFKHHLHRNEQQVLLICITPTLLG